VTHDLEIRSGYGTTMKFLCTFWFSGSGTVEFTRFLWPLPADLDFWTSDHFKVISVIRTWYWVTVISYVEISSFIQKIEGEKTQTHGQPDYLMLPVPSRQRRHKKLMNDWTLAEMGRRTSKTF